MKLEEIKKLASLVRLDMSEEEMIDIGSSFDSILGYVSQVQQLSDNDLNPVFSIENVMRDDVVTNDQGIYTDKIVANMPDSVDGYLKVKQIL